MVKGWEEKTIRDYALLVTKGTTPTSIGMNFTNAGIVFVKIESIVNNRIEKNLCAFINEGTNKALSRSILQENDILISIAGALGRSAKVEKCILPANTNQALAIVRLDERKVCIDYVYWYLQSDIIVKHIAEISVQGAQANLSLENINDLPIRIPIDTAEQRRIAAALSDTDECISALEKLIAKKRNIKQGAMQELLTGKRRLAGFRGEWVEEKLGEFGHCIRGVSYNPNVDLLNYDKRNAVVLLRANNIMDGKLEFDNVQYVRISIVSEEQTLSLCDIVIAMSSGSVIAIGKTGSYTGYSNRCCVGAFCAIFRSEYNDYIKFLFQSSMYREQLSAVLEGTSINNLNSRVIEGLTFPFPQDVAEQTAIAQILTDMDAEIDALTAKLAKLKNIKHGMMSELLTGRIRLTGEVANG